MAAEFEYLEISEEDGDVLVARIDRPPANAMSPELLEEGAALVESLRGRLPGAVVLTGTDRFFSGGMDLKLAPSMGLEDQQRSVKGINDLFSSWYGLECPVVAAVNGHAVAGGLILALCADLRICVPEASLGLTEARVGLPYPAAAMAVVRAELEPQAARRLVMEGSLIDSERALEMGAVDEVVAAEELMPRALEIARDLASMPRDAYAIVKKQLRGEVLESMREAVQADPMLEGWASAEAAGAAASVLDRPR